jgi:hypothetical protein
MHPVFFYMEHTDRHTNIKYPYALFMEVMQRMDSIFWAMGCQDQSPFVSLCPSLYPTLIPPLFKSSDYTTLFTNIKGDIKISSLL